MKKKEINLKKNSESKYKSIIDIFQHDGKEAWNTFIAFLIAQSIIFAFAGKSLSDLLGPNNTTKVEIIMFIGSTSLGLITSILLFLIYKRFSKYNEFRIGQIVANEPEEWNIMKGDGEKFSKGEKVILKYKFNNEVITKEYKIPCFYQMRAKHLISIVMLMYIFAYVGLFVLFLSK